MLDGELFVSCDCGSPEHTLRFILDLEGQMIHTEVYLNNYNNVFKRMWIALKYVFGYTSKYGHFDCTVMDVETASQLIQMINMLRRNVYNDTDGPSKQS